MKANGSMQTIWTAGSRSCVSRSPSLLRSQSGQSLVEVALLTPLLLALLVGGIELGRYAYISILVGNAARAGAAYGAQSLPQSTCPTPAPCGIQTAADHDFKSNGQKVSDLTVTVTNTCGCDSGGTVTLASSCVGTGAGICASGHWVVMVSVTASGTFHSLFSYPGIPPSTSLSRTVEMRVAQQ